MNGVASAFWAEVLAGTEPGDGRALPRRPRRQKARLVHTVSRREVTGLRNP